MQDATQIDGLVLHFHLYFCYYNFDSWTLFVKHNGLERHLIKIMMVSGRVQTVCGASLMLGIASGIHAGVLRNLCS